MGNAESHKRISKMLSGVEVEKTDTGRWQNGNCFAFKIGDFLPYLQSTKFYKTSAASRDMESPNALDRCRVRTCEVTSGIELSFRHDQKTLVVNAQDKAIITSENVSIRQLCVCCVCVFGSCVLCLRVGQLCAAFAR